MASTLDAVQNIATCRVVDSELVADGPRALLALGDRGDQRLALLLGSAHIRASCRPALLRQATFWRIAHFLAISGRRFQAPGNVIWRNFASYSQVLGMQSGGK